VSQETDQTKLIQAMRDSQFHELPEDIRRPFLNKWVEIDRVYAEAGGRAPITWAGPVPMHELIGKEVVASTEVGKVVGKAVYYSKTTENGRDFKRTVAVFVPSSGTLYEAPSERVHIAGQEDHARLEQEMVLASRLPAARATVIKSERTRSVKQGTHLLPRMMEMVAERKMVVEEKSGYHKVTGNAKKKTVYIAVKGGRVDLSGFSIDHAGITQISEEEAKGRHLGKVRGQIDFDRDDSVVLDALEKALVELQ
jgi:hypothetical protein